MQTGRWWKNWTKISGTLARLIGEQLGKEVDTVPGAGAAGGLGAGLMAFLEARLMKGFDMVAETVGLEESIQWADLVITGEGKMDSQTTFGKTPFGCGTDGQKTWKTGDWSGRYP